MIAFHSHSDACISLFLWQWSKGRKQLYILERLKKKKPVNIGSLFNSLRILFPRRGEFHSYCRSPAVSGTMWQWGASLPSTWTEGHCYQAFTSWGMKVSFLWVSEVLLWKSHYLTCGSDISFPWIWICPQLKLSLTFSLLKWLLLLWYIITSHFLIHFLIGE